MKVVLHKDNFFFFSSKKFLLLFYFPPGAINQLTWNFVCEWAKDNIRTNCVAPGQTPEYQRSNVQVLPCSFIHSPMYGINLSLQVSTLFSCNSSMMRRLMQKWSLWHSLGTMGEQKEIASLVAFLCTLLVRLFRGIETNQKKANIECCLIDEKNFDVIFIYDKN